MATLLQVPALLASLKGAPVSLPCTAVMAESRHILSQPAINNNGKSKNMIWYS